MFTYENGVAVAFFLWIYYQVAFLYSIHCLRAKNLRKIGRKISWLTLAPREMISDDLHRPFYYWPFKYIAINLFILPWILLSWLYVAWVVGALLFSMYKNYGIPQKVKEFQWKLKNIDMTRDQILKELMILNDQDVSEFEDFKASFMEEMRDRGLA